VTHAEADPVDAQTVETTAESEVAVGVDRGTGGNLGGAPIVVTKMAMKRAAERMSTRTKGKGGRHRPKRTLGSCYWRKQKRTLQLEM